MTNALSLIYKPIPTAFLAGAALSQVFAPTYAWPLLFFALPIFYHLLHTSPSWKSAAWRGFAFGYGYWMAGTWWIANALLVDAAAFGWLFPVSVLGLSALLAVWFALLGVLVYAVMPLHSGIRAGGGRRPRDKHGVTAECGGASILTFAALWTCIELLRSLGPLGFPWNLLGYSALVSLPLAQVAADVSVYGLSFLAALAGVLPVLLLHPTRRIKAVGVVLPMLIIAALYAYGAHRIPPTTEYTQTRLRLVQPNIPQAIKSTSAGDAESLHQLWTLSAQAGEGGKPDLTIWPETALPETLRGNHTILQLPKIGTIITGAVRVDGQRRIYNSLAVLTDSGEVRATYDKHQLVPFGEFIPLSGTLPLRKITPGLVDFTRGEGVQTLTRDGIPPFSPLICYEIIFPWMTARAAPRPHWILNVTNDGWYGDTAGPHQHLAAAQMRAIEQGLPVVRVANSGISAVIDPYGRIVAELPLNARGLLDVGLPWYKKRGEAVTNSPQSHHFH